MKKELIKTENYLLVVDDSEIKEGDMCVNIAHNMIVKPTDLEWANSNSDNLKVIVAASPELNIEGVPLLPPLEDDDSNKDLFYQKQVMNPYPTGGQSYASYEKGFIDGYNKAKEKYKFTEEDMKLAILRGYKLGKNGGDEISRKVEEKFLLSHLSQPKTPTHFDFEMEDGFSKNNDEYIDELGAKGNYYTHLKVIKTTTNSQGQEVACGKYIY